MEPVPTRGRIDVMDHGQVRCLCGRLLARWVPDGIQVKCKRCRRVVTIPFSEIEGAPAPCGAPLKTVAT
jgi:phage FluMu protein Com